MILILMFLGMIILGNIFVKFGTRNCSDFCDGLEIFGGMITTIGSVCLIGSIIGIILVHATAPKVIQEKKMNYEGLCRRYEIAKSEYEDISKSDVITDITAWNIEVYKTKYWSDNPWTNWYNPKEIADNLDYILLE